MFQEIYKLIQSCCCLHLQLIDSSQDGFFVLGYIFFVMGCFYVNFEQFCLVCVLSRIAKGEFIRF